jgi:transposase
MSKKKSKRKKSGRLLRVIRSNAAGIDIGATKIYVAVPDGRDKEPVRRFGTFTQDLNEAAQWLKSCGIDTIAIESTGVYWIPLFQVLESYGFALFLVNSGHVKHVPGRKTDVEDCQWIQYLHSVGLLNRSFRPPQEICAVCSLLRHRGNLIKASATHIQSLTQMNLQIHNVISDITGTTGLAILDAILAGERDPHKLAELRDPRIKSDKGTIAKSLEGHYLSEHLFTLKQVLQAYRHYKNMINECDSEIEKYLNDFDSIIDPGKNPLPKPKSPRKKPHGNEPHFDLRTHMYRILGTDLTQIDGINSMTAWVFFSEVGTDLSKFPSKEKFSKWLALSPNNKITGDKIKSSKTLKSKNRLAISLRLSAQSLWRSQSFLGDYYRRMRARQGAPKAITSTAHKLARIIYHLVKHRKKIDESVFSYENKLHKKRLETRIRKQAKILGFELVSTDS